MNIKNEKIIFDDEILKEHFTEKEIENLYKLINMNIKQIIIVDGEEYKRCTTCGQIKHVSNFYNHKGKDRYRSSCIPCTQNTNYNYLYKKKHGNDTGSL
jgi:hypothetical protein